MHTTMIKYQWVWCGNIQIKNVNVISLSFLARLGGLDNTSCLVYLIFLKSIIPYKLIRMLTEIENTTAVY